MVSTVRTAISFDREEKAIEQMDMQIETMKLDKDVHHDKIGLEAAKLQLKKQELEWLKKKKKEQGPEVIKPEIIDTKDVPLPPMYDFKTLKPKDMHEESDSSDSDSDHDKKKKKKDDKHDDKKKDQPKGKDK